MAKIISLIPARSGSKRIKDKNIKLLHNIPLLAYSIIVSLKCEEINRIIVSSDSQEYLDIAKKYHAVPLKRPLECCQDDSGDDLVVRQCLDKHPSDYILYLRPTTPFRSPVIIKEIISTMVNNKNATGLRSVEEMGESAYKCFTMQKGYIKPLISTGKNINNINNVNILNIIRRNERTEHNVTDLPNQLVPPTYRGNGYGDMILSSQVRRGSLWGDSLLGFLTPRVIEIDSPEDFKYAEWWAKENRWDEEY